MTKRKRTKGQTMIYKTSTNHSKGKLLTLPNVSTSATGNGPLFVDASLAHSKSISINNNIHGWMMSLSMPMSAK
jgi:hypothetical protein